MTHKCSWLQQEQVRDGGYPLAPVRRGMPASPTETGMGGVMDFQDASPISIPNFYLYSIRTFLI